MRNQGVRELQERMKRFGLSIIRAAETLPTKGAAHKFRIPHSAFRI